MKCNTDMYQYLRGNEVKCRHRQGMVFGTKLELRRDVRSSRKVMQDGVKVTCATVATNTRHGSDWNINRIGRKIEREEAEERKGKGKGKRLQYIHHRM